jgi:NDP-sugar pyrophosphorylase family protein
MPIATRPLLEINLGRLRAAGAETVIINTHHLYHQVEAFVAARAESILLSHESRLLDSGGALVKARDWLGPAPFLVSNADIVHKMDISLLSQALRENDAAACLGLTDAPLYNNLALDEQGLLLGIKGRSPLPSAVKLHTFTGLACYSPRLLDYLPASGPSSIVDGWLQARAAGERIMGLVLPGLWDDLGAWNRLWAANARAAEELDLAHGSKYLAAPLPGVTAPPPGVTIEGFCFLSAGAQLQAGAYVKDSLLLPGARVSGRGRVERAILGRNFLADGEYRDGAFA